MQSQKLADSVLDMLLSKNSDGGNSYDELRGQQPEHVSKLVSRIMMITVLTLSAPAFRCNFSRI